MEREALKAAFPTHRLHRRAPAGRVQVEIWLDGPAVIADPVEETAHVVDEQAACARFIHEEHHAGGFAADVRQRRELARAHADDTRGRVERERKRIVGLLRQRRDGDQQQDRRQKRARIGHARGLRLEWW
jgi:hypothetical protein